MVKPGVTTRKPRVNRLLPGQVIREFQQRVLIGAAHDTSGSRLFHFNVSGNALQEQLLRALVLHNGVNTALPSKSATMT
jgi:hypothetical protein